MYKLICKLLCREVLKENERLKIQNQELRQKSLGNIEAIQKTKVGKNDILIFTTDAVLSDAEFKGLKSSLKVALTGIKPKPKALCLDGGLELKVLSLGQK